MTCFKAQNFGLMPHHLQRLDDLGAGDLPRQWAAYLELPSPGGDEIEGICLGLLDSETAGCISYFLERDLDEERLCVLRQSRNQLALVTPRLQGKARGYFAALAELVEAVLNKAEPAP